MEQILTPSEPDKSLPPLHAFFLFHSPLHLLSSRLICHYLFLSHSLSSPFCCGLFFSLPLCPCLSLSLSSLLPEKPSVRAVGSGLSYIPYEIRLWPPLSQFKAQAPLCRAACCCKFKSSNVHRSRNRCQYTFRKQPDTTTSTNPGWAENMICE